MGSIEDAIESIEHRKEDYESLKDVLGRYNIKVDSYVLITEMLDSIDNDRLVDLYEHRSSSEQFAELAVIRFFKDIEDFRSHVIDNYKELIELQLKNEENTDTLSDFIIQSENFYENYFHDYDYIYDDLGYYIENYEDEMKEHHEDIEAYEQLKAENPDDYINLLDDEDEYDELKQQTIRAIVSVLEVEEVDKMFKDPVDYFVYESRWSWKEFADDVFNEHKYMDFDYEKFEAWLKERDINRLKDFVNIDPNSYGGYVSMEDGDLFTDVAGSFPVAVVAKS